MNFDFFLPTPADSESVLGLIVKPLKKEMILCYSVVHTNCGKPFQKGTRTIASYSTGISPGSQLYSQVYSQIV